jgi:hypothetical protein
MVLRTAIVDVLSLMSCSCIRLRRICQSCAPPTLRR